MTEEELAALAVWLRRMQGIELDPALLRDPAAVAETFGALAGRASADLPFGAEPSGFDFATDNLTRPSRAHPGGKLGSGGDAG
jgi:hypothetical protein